MKKEKLGFFKKLFLVITDFRTYPFLVKNEKFHKSIIYLLTLTLFITLIYAANIVYRFNIMLEDVIYDYNEVIPEFKLSDGILNVDGKYNEKIDSESFLVIDTEYTYDEYIKTKEYGNLVIYDTVALVNSDRIMIEAPTFVLKITFDEINYEVTKDSFYNMLIQSRSSLDYLPYLVILYMSIFIGYFIVLLIRVLFMACIISIICFFTGIRLSFRNYIKMAIYIYSLPLIIELITLCLVGTIKSYAYYTILLLTYIYIIYAIRAVRLDVFIMMFSKKSQAPNVPTEVKNEFEKYNDLVNNEENKEEKKDNEEDKND